MIADASTYVIDDTTIERERESDVGSERRTLVVSVFAVVFVKPSDTLLEGQPRTTRRSTRSSGPQHGIDRTTPDSVSSPREAVGHIHL
ncbi:hypothetical protein ACFQKF_04845 [Halalkalicoccus sp. GCM10025322]|uniref:hypothetical protein n=1 Tax=Halalkalicoccus TaxID=332246 RepID=UPI002F969304